MGRIYSSARVPGAGGKFCDPRDFSNLAIWLRADQNVTIATGASAWTDINGSGRSVVQAVGANQPAFVASAANGQPGLSFDGTNDVLAGAFTLIQPCQVHIVFKTTAGAPSLHDCIMDGSTNLGMALFVDTTPQTYMFAGGAQPITASSINNGTFGAMTLRYNNASSVMRNNGIQIATGTTGAGNANGLTLGALGGVSRWAVCTICEVIIYSAIQADAVTFELERYQRQRHGTP